MEFELELKLTPYELFKRWGKHVKKNVLHKAISMQLGAFRIDGFEFLV